MDKISKLPPGVTETILCRLPIQEAARTSILSTEWRYHWINIPQLAFIENTFEVSTDGAELSILEQTFDEPSKRREMATRCKLFYAIYQVLLIHQGPIHKFTLSMRADGSCVEIDHIILQLSKENTVKILKLDFSGRYKLPSSFFSLRQLTHLYLNDCALDPKPSFNGFGSLIALYLQHIWMSEKALVRLLSGCPSLKRLIINSDGSTITDDGDLTIVDLFDCLPVIEYLSVWFYIVMFFGPERLPKELPTTLVHLKFLCIRLIWFNHEYGLRFLVLLIRSSPNLEKLKLVILEDTSFDVIVTGPFTIKDFSDIKLEHLKELEIINFSNEANELDFVKLMLAKSPVLRKLKICFLYDQLDEDKELEISRIILTFPCASPVVKKVIVGSRNPISSSI